MSSRVPVLVAFAFCLALTAGAVERIRLRADLWMPFTGDPAGEQPGYAVEIVRKIFVPRGVIIDYQIMPWGDALTAVESGKIDGVIAASRAEAARLILPAEPLGESRIGIFVRKASPWSFENLGSLQKIKLGVLLDYKYWRELDAYISSGREPQIVRIGGDNPIGDALDKLKSGEIDALPETASVFAWAVGDAGYKAADFQTAYLHEGEIVYVAFARRGEQGARYAAMFDAGMKELRESGELQKILTRYGLTDWKP